MTETEREVATILAERALQRRHDEIEKSRPSIPTPIGGAVPASPQAGRFIPFEEAE